MQIIPLRAFPNQSVSFTLDGNRWDVTVKQARVTMIADVVINDVPIIYGSRILAGSPVLPFIYQMQYGNLLLLAEDDQLSDWRRFEADQILLYVSPAELA